MNHIFRTVWNHALGAMVAVSEVGAVRGKSVSQQTGTAVSASFFALNTASALVAIAWAASNSIAFAAPAGGVAVVGQMSTTTQGNLTTVTTQNGAGLNYSAINWQSFSIPQGTSTYFQQPSSTSAVINRVVTNTPSQLFGTLGSNGQLVLVNQAGITVGAGAVVDTAGFTASALKMSDADALAGRMRFGDGTAGGAVSVQGQVLARSGDVVLIGSSVDTAKDALVRAPNGSTILAAGQQVEITGRGLEGISMTVQAPENSAVNLGALQGDAVAIFAGTLKHSGAIQATRATLEGGRVVLKAAGDAIVDGNASITATGTVGGSVDVLGQRVGLTDQASIDVSGSQGGGQVRIGGDYQGKNAALPNAQFAYVGKDVSITANATNVGKGGRVIVWADDSTRAYGSIEAKGGANGGDGGVVETSGKRALDVNGIRVSAAASAGKAGTWLLDPADVTISSVSGDMVQTGGLFVPVNGASTVLASTLVTTLNAGTDVTITTYDTTLNPTAFSGGTASGDITLGMGTSLAWTSSAKLTLDAYNSITLNSYISAPSGQVNLLASNHAGATAGTISSSYAVDVKKLQAVANGNITLSASSQIEYLAAKSVAGAIDISSSHASGLTIADVGGTSGVSALGNISIRQYTAGGITVSSSVRSTGSSYQTLLGIASGSGGISVGADVVGKTLQLYTSGGNISQSGGGVKDGGGGTTLSAGSSTAGSISLTSGFNDFSSVSISGGSPSALSLTDANALQVNGFSAAGAVSLKAGGDLSFSNIGASGNTVSLSAGGALIQASETSFNANAVVLSAGTGVGSSSNSINTYSIANVSASTSTGGVYIDSSAAPVTIQGITAGSGDIVVTNYGGITTTGLVSTGSGSVTMTANSPLTVGAGGVSATGNISLTAASTGNMTLNGPIKSSLGSVTLSATGGTLTQNSSVYGATGVTASASSMVYGAAATTSNAPVSYTAGGSAVTPPVDPIATATSSGALVTTFEDLLTAAVEEQAQETLVAQNQEQKKDPLLEGTTGGEICLR